MSGPAGPAPGRLATLLRSYLPQGRVGRVLSVGGFIDSAGSGLFLALVPVYLVLKLSADPVKIGLAVGAANLIGLSATVIFGTLVDRLGALRVWQLLLLGRAVGYGAFVIIDSFWQYVILLFLLVPLDRGSGTAQQAYVVQQAEPAQRNLLMAGIRTARNIGMSLGLLASGAIIALDSTTAFRVGFGLNALSLIALLVAVTALGRSPAANPTSPAEPADNQGPAGPADTPEPVGPGAAVDSAGPPGPWRNPRYLLLSAGDALLMLSDSVLFTLLPLWLVARTDAPAALVGPLLAVNTVLTIVLQVPLSSWANSLPGARRMILRATGALLATCCLFAAAEYSSTVVATILVLLGVLALTLGENLHAVASFELSHRLAPPAMIGRYLGVFHLGISVQRTVGPPFMTAVVLRGTLGWVALVAAFGVGLVMMRAGAPAQPGRHRAEDRDNQLTGAQR